MLVPVLDGYQQYQGSIAGQIGENTLGVRLRLNYEMADGFDAASFGNP